MPLVGSSRMMIFGFVASHLAITTFCWLPPDRLSDLGVERGGAQVEPLGEVARQLELLGQPDEARCARCATATAG